MDMKLKTDLIKELRGRKLWSQDELATASGVSLRTIQRLEKGEAVSMETAKALAAALEVPHQELVRNETFTGYRHTQIGWTIILFVFTAWVILMVFEPVRIPVSLVFGLVLVMSYSLNVKVDSEKVSWRFGIGLIHKREPVSEIASAEIVQNKWWWGWGIRFIPPGHWLYNVSGLDAVEITLKSGRKFRIGTDEPNYLCQAVIDSVNASN